MSSRPWGYRSGPYQIVRMKMDSSTAAAIVPGDFVVPVTAGYVGQAAAGGLPIGVAVSAGADPAADGEADVWVNISTDAIYEYPPDTGTVTQSLVGCLMDIGGAQSVDIDATTDDILRCVGVDLERNTLFVQLVRTNLGL